MRIGTRAMLTAAVALVVIASFTVGASARNLSVTEQNYDMRWTGIELTSGAARVRCNIKLTGSFHARSLSKMNQTLIGYIKSTRVETCANGSIAFPGTSLPWHVQYGGFAGTLPNITSIRPRIVGAAIRVTDQFGAVCEYVTEREHPIVVTVNREVGRVITEVRPSASDRISGVGVCAGVMLSWEEKRGEFTKVGVAETILLTLI